MSEHDGKQVATPRPSTEDAEAWKAYWQAQGQPWRTQPEIDTERQEELKRCLATETDIEKGKYPFKDVKLSRAEIEWLLAAHESGGIRGPVDCSDERQRMRKGLDLRGAHLQEEDLSGLPLARIRCGLALNELFRRTGEQIEMAAVHVQKANLRGANVQEADLSNANVQKASLREANVQKASLRGANLQEATLFGANVQEADLTRAQLKGANLERVTLSNEKQVGPGFVDCQWSDVNLAVIEWSQVRLLGDESVARQKRDSEGKTKEKQTKLSEYKKAVRANRQLAVALEGQGLNEEAARFAYRAQTLQKSVLWYQMTQSESSSYPTQQRVTFGQRMQALGGWLFSWFLFLLAGYGYKPIRSVMAYLIIIFGFMCLYLLNAHFIAPHLTWHEALVLSVSSFHGRGFFTQNVTLGDTYARLASIEAVVGLFIEISFIATFTQRFFGK